MRSETATLQDKKCGRRLMSAEIRATYDSVEGFVRASLEKWETLPHLFPPVLRADNGNGRERRRFVR
jgi:hypothetical protein